MEAFGMKSFFNRSHLALALCLAALMGCTRTSEEPSQTTSPMSGIVMNDQVCAQCHGQTGESFSPLFPKLAGQQKEYLKLQLADFKDHARSDKTGTQYMWGFTHLTQTQIAELADYFSSQSPMKADADTPDARGELIFRQGLPGAGVAQCSSCHGADGQGDGPIPRLAGQHAAYMSRQIKVLQQTELRPRDALMKQHHSLSDADAESVAHYMATLGAKK
ncbi:c-type cytochrome [Pseudomonas sp. URMO17WK12:I12]|uniref:c-type cytochrome n=1 Tax=Pseudomonas sp. URMO17WK12:I12 TaxID=1259797 RepID=UPI0004839F79|nr:c-type cytochrome [Pseudomonas sp. URMO17WK12:I12]